MNEKLIEINKIVDTHIRPHIRSHGGDIQVAGIEGDCLTIKLTGQCAGCPLSQISTAEWIESTINELNGGQKLKVKVYNEISDDIWDFAKSILRKH